MTIKRRVFTGLMLLSSLAAADELTPGFIPDVTFKGSTLAGWHTLGQAEWRAENGEIVGSPKRGGDGSGGWLVLDHSYQDIGFFASFLCSDGCKTGVLLRAQKTPDGGMKGIYVSLTQGDLASYAVVLDPQGKELKREKLRPAGGQIRIAPPPDPNGSAARRPTELRPVAGPPGVTLPIDPPSSKLLPGQWNQFEVILDANILRPHLNVGGGGVEGGAADENFGTYGPMAIYIGGTGDVRLKNVEYKDLSVKVTPSEKVSGNFRMQRLNDFYYSWSAAAADINHDGIMDVVAGPYYYLGPDYTTSREIYLAETRNPSTQYASTMMNFAYDFTGDGWPDVLTVSPGKAATLYVNPKGENRRWDHFDVVPKVLNEFAMLKDVDGDGKPELVYGADGYLRYAKPDPANPTGAWVVHTVSESGPWGAIASHGLGVGDINGDGRMDIVQAYGWWEQPPAGSKQEPWTYHPEAFGRWEGSRPGGAELAVYDVNGDGLNDVVTSLEAHGFGLAWFEQKRDKDGKISFVQHMIMDNFSSKNAGSVTFTEPHATTFADIDGDGIPDYIVGKRFWSHEDSYTDPDPYGAPVLYVFKTVRNPRAPGGAEFVPELIHNRSGAGSNIAVADLNGDGALDILTSTDRGTFIFWNNSHAGGKKHSK